MIPAYIIYILFSVAMGAFFSGSETAFISTRYIKLIHLIEKKDKHALLVHQLLRRPDRLLATTLIGTNVSVVVASALTTKLIYQFNQDAASILATCILAPIVLTFGEIIPKTISQNRAHVAALKLAPFLSFAQKLFAPLLAIVGVITTSLLYVIAPRAIKKNPFLTREEIKLLIRDIAQDGVIEDYERNVIDRILEFTLSKAADIMVPLKEVASINYGASRAEIIEISKRFGFTRLPVLEDKQIRGVINIFDLFYHDENRNWRQFIRPLRLVSFDERLDVVFSKMQPNKETMVGVMRSDAAVGILTMEDLIEEIILQAKSPQKEATNIKEDTHGKT